MNNRKIFSNVFVFLGVFAAIYTFGLSSAGEVSAQTCGGGGYYDYEEYHCDSVAGGVICNQNRGTRYIGCTVQVGRCQRVFFMRTRTCTIGKIFNSTTDCWYSGDGSVTNMTTSGCGWMDPPPDWTPPPVVVGGCNYSCTSNANCSGGLVCTGGYCKNSLCTTDADCICGSYIPPDRSCNASCNSDSDCDTNYCYNGRCRKAACQSDADCICDKCAISNATAAIRTRYDTNGNGAIDDSDETIQGTNSASCGAYKTVSGFIYQQSGGDGSIQAPVHNNCSYSEDGKPNAQWRPIHGGGDNRFSGSIWLAGIPAGYKVLTAQSSGCTWNSTNKRLECDFCGKKIMDFLVTDAQTNWCDISLNPSAPQYAAPATVTVTVRGRANKISTDPVNNPTVRVWFSRIDGTRIPNDDISPAYAMYYDAAYNRYFYQIKSAGCNSQNQSLCSKTTSVTLPAADYYAHCDVWTDPEKCSGNPTCTYEAGGFRPCTGWQSCSVNDNKVKEVHLPCVTGIISPVCSNGGTSVTLGFTGGFNSNNADQYRFNYGGLLQYRTTPGNVTYNGLTTDVDRVWFIQARRPYNPAPWTGQTCPNDPHKCLGATCTITMPYDVTKKQGDPPFAINPTAIFTNMPAGGTAEVRYTSSNTTIATINPASRIDNTPPSYTGPFSTIAYPGNVVGTTTVTGSCYINGTIYPPSSSMLINVLAADPWWKVVDADVWSSGRIKSDVPLGTGDYFDEIATYSPGYPGVPVYNYSTFEVPSSRISTKGWRANSSTIYTTNESKRFDYDFFWDNLPSDVGTTIDGGNISNPSVNLSYFNTNDGYYYDNTYYIFKRVGDLIISSNSPILSGRKVILFVDGTVTLNNGVSPYAISSYGNTLFMVIASKNIDVSPNVTRLDGIFVAGVKDPGDGVFSTGTTGGSNDGQLVVDGSVVAWNGVNLQRVLSNNFTNPAEKFVYKPQLLLNIPSFFGLQTMKWREVEP